MAISIDPFAGTSNQGWVPVFDFHQEASDAVYLRLREYTGGAGKRPTAMVGYFLGSDSSYVENVADAYNLAGLLQALLSNVPGAGLDEAEVLEQINTRITALMLGTASTHDVGTAEGQIPVVQADGMLSEDLLPPAATGYDDTAIQELITNLTNRVMTAEEAATALTGRVDATETATTANATNITALQERKEVLNDVVDLSESEDGDVIVARDTGRISTTQQFHHSGTPATATWTNVQVGSTLWGSHRFRGVLGEDPGSNGSMDNDLYLHPSRGWRRYESGGFFPARWNGVFIPNLSGYDDTSARWVGYRSSQAAATADPQTQNGAYAAYNLILARASFYVAGDPPTTSYDRIEVLNHDDIATVAQVAATATTAPTTAAHQIPTLEGLHGALDALPDSGASSFADLTGQIADTQIADRGILNRHIADEALGAGKLGLAVQARLVETGGDEGQILSRVGTDQQAWIDAPAGDGGGATNFSQLAGQAQTAQIADGAILEAKLSQAVRDLLRAGVEYPTQQEIDDGVETPFTVAVRRIVNDHIQITGFADANRALWDNDSPYRSGNIVRLEVNGEDRFYICTQTHDASDPPSDTPSPDSAAAYGRWVDITASPVDVLRYSAQTLTSTQQEQARLNIGAGTPGSGGGGATSFSDLSGQALRAQIADDAIDASKLATGAVDALAIATGAVVSTKLASGAVGSLAIATQAVVNTKLATNAVSTTKIVDQAITEAKIANGAVSVSRLATDASARLVPPVGAEGQRLTVGANDSLVWETPAVASPETPTGQIYDGTFTAAIDPGNPNGNGYSRSDPENFGTADSGGITFEWDSITYTITTFATNGANEFFFNILPDREQADDASLESLVVRVENPVGTLIFNAPISDAVVLNDLVWRFDGHNFELTAGQQFRVTLTDPNAEEEEPDRTGAYQDTDLLASTLVLGTTGGVIAQLATLSRSWREFDHLRFYLKPAIGGKTLSTKLPVRDLVEEPVSNTAAGVDMRLEAVNSNLTVGFGRSDGPAGVGAMSISVGRLTSDTQILVGSPAGASNRGTYALVQVKGIISPGRAASTGNATAGDGEITEQNILSALPHVPFTAQAQTTPTTIEALVVETTNPTAELSLSVESTVAGDGTGDYLIGRRQGALFFTQMAPDAPETQSISNQLVGEVANIRIGTDHAHLENGTYRWEFRIGSNTAGTFSTPQLTITGDVSRPLTQTVSGNSWRLRLEGVIDFPHHDTSANGSPIPLDVPIVRGEQSGVRLRVIPYDIATDRIRTEPRYGYPELSDDELWNDMVSGDALDSSGLLPSNPAYGYYFPLGGVPHKGGGNLYTGNIDKIQFMTATGDDSVIDRIVLYGRAADGFSQGVLRGVEAR